MSSFLRNNGLSLVMFASFCACFVGQAVAGAHHYNEERRLHGQPAVAFVDYLGSGEFIEATFENWESEFLQMAAFVMLSAILVQKGSAESRDPEGEPELDADPRLAATADSPWPVHRGGFALALYKRSLSIALFLLFAISFVLHAIGGRLQHNEQAREHGQQTLTTLEYVASATFWFESLQNWQSEFLSVGVLIVLSIFLRQSGSPESKPVHAPHSQTGE